MKNDFYKDIAADYDRMIRWERRLSVERPWFEALLDRFHLRSVLDASCGSGHHVVLLDSMGVETMGTDASCSMLALARETLGTAGLNPDERLRCAAWQELPRVVPETFDGVLCIGNSLPYVLNTELMRESLKGLWSRVKPGGILLIQYKNFEKLIATRQRLLPISFTPPPEERIALRVYEYQSEHVLFNVFLLDKTDGEWSVRHHATPLKPYRPEEVAEPLREFGAEVSLHGSLGLDPFVVEESEDVVVLARKAAGR